MEIIVNKVKGLMPQLARIKGVWEGAYAYVDPNGKLLDQHQCKLIHIFPDDNPEEYHQINEYIWNDGKKERLEFVFKLQGNELSFTHPRAVGYVWEEKLRIGELATLRVSWLRSDHQGYSPYDLPNCCVHELIQINSDATKRARVWQWFQNEELVQRTVIEEVRVS